MSKRAFICGFFFLGLALLIGAPPVDSAVTGGGGGGKGKTIKKFTGILTGGTLKNGDSAGGPGTLLQHTYNVGGKKNGVDIDSINFICDPRRVNWVIEIDIDTKGSTKTEFINEPRFCDHVEVEMWFFAMDDEPPPHGKAIYVKKIP